MALADFLLKMTELKSLFVKFFKFFGIVAVIVGIVAGLAMYSFSSLPTIGPLPTPNGYDGIVRAGKTISGTFRNYKSMLPAELQAALKTNAAPIAQGKEALKLECRVPLSWPPAPLSGDESTAPLNLSEAFAAEGLVAETEHRTEDAVKSYQNIVHLGYQSCQGGLVGDGLRGIAIVSSGVDRLQKLSVILNSKSCAQIARDLQSLDSQSETLADYVRQQKIWYHQNAPGAKDTFDWYYGKLRSLNADTKAHEDATHSFAQIQSDIRHNIVAIAVRAYEADKGVRPDQIEDLVPNYLNKVPIDPETRTNLSLAL